MSSGGIFDLHVEKAIQAGWSTYAADLALFKALFTEDGIADAVLEEWHTGLTASGVRFRMAEAPGHDPFSLVLVKLTEERNDIEPMGGGFAGREPGGEERLAMILTQQVQVFIGTPHPELTRALHVVIRAIMQWVIPQFLQGPYINVRYEGMTAPTPEEKLVSEQLGIISRVQRYSAMTQVLLVAEAAPPALSWFVTVDGIDEDGTTGVEPPGGVTPILD